MAYQSRPMPWPLRSYGSEGPQAIAGLSTHYSGGVSRNIHSHVHHWLGASPEQSAGVWAHTMTIMVITDDRKPGLFTLHDGVTSEHFESRTGAALAHPLVHT